MQKDNQKALDQNCGLLEEGEILPFKSNIMLRTLWMLFLTAVLWGLNFPCQSSEIHEVTSCDKYLSQSYWLHF